MSNSCGKSLAGIFAAASVAVCALSFWAEKDNQKYAQDAGKSVSLTNKWEAHVSGFDPRFSGR